MKTYIELEGIKIECNEGAEKAFNLLKNIKDFKLDEKNVNNTPNKEIVSVIDNTLVESLKLEIENLKKENKDLNDNISIISSMNNSEDEALTENYNKALDKIENLEKELIVKNGDIETLKHNIKNLEEEKTKLNNAIELMKTQVSQPVAKEEPVKIEEVKKVDTKDFDPNNKEDIDWLKKELNTAPTPIIPTPEVVIPKVEIPQTVVIPTPEVKVEQPTNGEYIDGHLVERNGAGDIIKVGDAVLNPHECMALKFKITTVAQIVSNRAMMEDTNKNRAMAQGWEK